jgi:phosphonate transport system permease protein
LSRPDFSNEKATRLVAVEMWETVQMAFLATTISAVTAIIFTFFSARPASAWGRGASNLLQIMLSVVRAVHPLLTTIPVIILVGIGPTAGVLALTLFSTATFIADYSEYTQQHASLSWPILLNVHFPALAFKHYHVNIVIATVLGFMGGGGIGFSLLQNINLLNYSDAGIAIFACIITIGSFDLLGRVVWYKIQRN